MVERTGDVDDVSYLYHVILIHFVAHMTYDQQNIEKKREGETSSSEPYFELGCSASCLGQIWVFESGCLGSSFVQKLFHCTFFILFWVALIKGLVMSKSILMSWSSVQRMTTVQLTKTITWRLWYSHLPKSTNFEDAKDFQEQSKWVFIPFCFKIYPWSFPATYLPQTQEPLSLRPLFSNIYG